MPWKPYAATEYVILLLAARDPQGLLHIPAEHALLPGKLFRVRPRELIGERLAQLTEELMGFAPQGTTWWVEPDFSPTFTLPEEITSALSLAAGTEVTLYVASQPGATELQGSYWSTLPKALRALPATPYRRYYLKAWQVLMGGLKQDSKAICWEDGDDVHSHIKNLHSRI